MAQESLEECVWFFHLQRKINNIIKDKANKSVQGHNVKLVQNDPQNLGAKPLVLNDITLNNFIFVQAKNKLFPSQLALWHHLANIIIEFQYLMTYQLVHVRFIYVSVGVSKTDIKVSALDISTIPNITDSPKNSL